MLEGHSSDLLQFHKVRDGYIKKEMVKNNAAEDELS